MFFWLLAGMTTKSLAQHENLWENLLKKNGGHSISAEKDTPFSGSKWTVNQKLDKILDSLADKSRKAKLIHGYRILIYSGNSRDEAGKAKELAYKTMSALDVYTTYSNPTFKVKMGDFYQKLDAYLVMKKLQGKFPSAVLVEEIVNLKL